MELQITRFPEGDIQKLEVQGEIDVANADVLRTNIVEALNLKPSEVIINMADVSYIDSTGIGVLVGGAHSAQEAGAVLKVQNPQPSVKRVFTLLGVDEKLHIQ